MKKRIIMLVLGIFSLCQLSYAAASKVVQENTKKETKKPERATSSKMKKIQKKVRKEALKDLKKGK